jgi:signal transduction histidine kinase
MPALVALEFTSSKCLDVVAQRFGWSDLWYISAVYASQGGGMSRGPTAAVSVNPATETRQVDLLSRLAHTRTPREAAAEIVHLARSVPCCSAATVVSTLDGTKLDGGPASPFDDEELTLARKAAMQETPTFSEDGLRLAIPLFEAHSTVLCLAFEGQADGLLFIETFSLTLRVAGRHLCLLLELSELQTSLRRLERSERVQHALFAISDLAGSDQHMPDVLRGIQTIVGSLMYAENFFIVLYNAERDTLRFLYFVDVEDPRPRDPSLEITMKSRERSLTWYLIRDGKPLMGSTEQLIAQISGPYAPVGPGAHDWLGVPMLRDGQVRGAIVVQSYTEGVGFSEDDRTLLQFVASHILIALGRKQDKEDLEQRVRQRTSELAAANEVLHREVVERQRAEDLQKALFQIARLATADISQDQFYQRVHMVVGTLLNAENFFIGLLSEDRTMLEFPYYLDGDLDSLPSRPLRRRLSEYVLRHGKPLLVRRADVAALTRACEIDPEPGDTQIVCWLGLPLFVDDRPIGLIVVQSYDPAVTYGPADEELLSFVALQVANSLHRRHTAESLQKAYAQLEQRVEERTHDLSDTLNQLRDTQDDLVRQEKNASLGALVAGIAHEVNTPLGICVTAVSYLAEETELARTHLAAQNLTEGELESHFASATETLKILTHNTRRASDLIRSFKQLAVDQSCDDLREFALAEYIEETLKSLRPKLRRTRHAITVNCHPALCVRSVPGALSQILTNLVINSIVHGFEHIEAGQIRIHAYRDESTLTIDYEDDGVGMPADALKRLFDPFYTTKRGQGGSGLGANIVHNLVTAKLGGTIEVDSAPGAGLHYHIRLPVQPPQTAVSA